MLKGTIVHKSSNNGTPVIVRYFNDNDAEALWEYINTLSKEKTFITFQGEKISLEQEREYVKNQIEKIETGKSIQLILLLGDKLSGIAGIEITRGGAMKHQGDFGISLSKEARGKGLGRLFMKTIVEETKKNLPGLRIITLSVFENNPIAHSLYKKFGFIEYGTLPKGILHKGKFIGEIKMYKEVDK